LPGSCPSCLTDRSIAGPRLPNACPSSKVLCHPLSSDTSHSSWSVAAKPAMRPPLAGSYRSSLHPPPSDASTDAPSAHSAAALAPPSAPRSCVRPAALAPSGTTAQEAAGLHATTPSLSILRTSQTVPRGSGPCQPLTLIE